MKGYRFLSFTKNMSETIGKNISKNLSGKYSQKIDHTKHSATDVLKTSSRRVIHKTPEASRDLSGNKSANKITKVLKNLETVTNENHKEISKERYHCMKSVQIGRCLPIFLDLQSKSLYLVRIQENTDQK